MIPTLEDIYITQVEVSLLNSYSSRPDPAGHTLQGLLLNLTRTTGS